MTIDIGATEEFPDNRVRIVQANGKEVGIVRWRGAFYGLSTVCAHQDGPICQGILSGRLTGGAPGEMRLEQDAPTLSCPWHGWEFDVRTGRALLDHRYRLRRFPVRVQSGRVLVDFEP